MGCFRGSRGRIETIREVLFRRKQWDPGGRHSHPPLGDHGHRMISSSQGHTGADRVFRGSRGSGVQGSGFRGQGVKGGMCGSRRQSQIVKRRKIGLEWPPPSSIFHLLMGTHAHTDRQTLQQVTTTDSICLSCQKDDFLFCLFFFLQNKGKSRRLKLKLKLIEKPSYPRQCWRKERKMKRKEKIPIKIKIKN